MTAAYDGLRVLDASRGIAAAMATMYFADQGADVVRILPPDTQSVDLGPGYLCWDRNKRLCALDRETPAGVAELRRLAAGADLVVFDDPPGELERVGLDADTLLAHHPSLLHLWMPMLGPAAPWGALPQDPLLADAVSTASGEHSSYDGGPLAMVTPITAYTQGMLGATTAAAALLERFRSGRGQGLMVSGLHAVAAMQAAVLTDAPGIVRPRPRGGGALASFRLYQCADGTWLYLGALTNAMFIAALEVLDLVDVLVMPGVEGQMINLMKPGVGDAVADRLQDRFRTRPRDEWLALLTEAGVANAPAQTRAQWWASDAVASNAMRVLLPHPELGAVEVPGDPLRLSRTPGGFSHLPSAGTFVPAAEIWTEPLAVRPTTPAGASGAAPLAGLRVLDLGSFVAGPFGSSLLSDFGAEVVKVEGPDGDPYRAFSVSFLAFHKGQQNVVLDLKSDGGKQALYDLVRSADVLLDNLRPGTPERIGTDYATLAAINPRLVRGTVTAWGPGNLLSDTPAFDPLLQSRSGLIVAQGGDAEPCASAMLVHDIGTGTLIALGILTALYARERDGLGQEVTTTMVNASIMLQSGEFVRYDGRPEPVVGCHDFVGSTALHRLYPCREGWIALAVTTPEHVAGLRRVLALPDLDPASALAAPAAGPLSDAVLRALSTRDAPEVVECLAAEEVPAAPVLAYGGYLADPWIAANRILAPIEDPALGTCTVVRTYAEWSRSRHAITATAPQPGEDTRAVLRGAGYDEDRINRLIEAGAAKQRDACGACDARQEVSP